MKSNKAQQEIVGFTLIVVIIVIILLILLSILRKDSNEFNKDEIISKLLSSSMYYTTDCAKVFVPQYRSLQELIKACYNNASEKCSDNRNPCIVLNDTLKNIIGKSLKIDPEAPNKAYSINIKYNSTGSTTPIKNILDLKEGKFQNCSSIVGYNNKVQDTDFIGTAIIETTLRVCQG
jgi:hypothetical protein